MSVLKYTKTSTFLFPLLNIPKEFFKCEVKNSFGTILFHSRFINAYLYNNDVVTDTCIHLLIRSYQDPGFHNFYKTITSLENYVDDYEKDGFLIVIIGVPEENINDFYLILKGQYSKISKEARTKIFKNSFFSGNISVLPMIFSKALALKEMWEKELSTPEIGFIADLGDQEVWSILDEKKETLDEDVFVSLKEFSRKSNIIKT